MLDFYMTERRLHQGLPPVNIQEGSWSWMTEDERFAFERGAIWATIKGSGRVGRVTVRNASQKARQSDLTSSVAGVGGPGRCLIVK